MSARTPKPPQRLDWLVYKLGGPKATLLGTVKAPNHETALAMAFDEFNVAPAERRRIIVQSTSEPA